MNGETTMAYSEFEYDNALGRAAAKARKERPKTKREQAADMFNAARKLAKEALEEENKAAEVARVEKAMVEEYGPRLR